MKPFVRRILSFGTAISAMLLAFSAHAAPPEVHGEMDLQLPNFDSVQFLGMSGRLLLMGGLVICALGLLFGMIIYDQLKKLPVHKSMKDISELIYETCKTYLWRQGKFILILEVFIGT